jgi:hypothetical protein
MDRLLARLERRLGRFAVPNLTWVIAAGMAAAFVLSLVRPEFLSMLVLDIGQIRHGQVWRLVTYLFLPPPGGPIWMLFGIYWFWLIGTNLENEWGAFKFNAFYLVGMLGTTIAALISGGASGNAQLNLSLFLAFATLFPDYQIFLFFIIPVRVKWLGLITGGFLLFQLVAEDWGTRGAIFAALANYVVFFSGHWLDYFRSRNLRVRQAARRAGQPEPARQVPGRACAICGAQESDGADIRVCSCEKCGGKPRTLCVAHARNH